MKYTKYFKAWKAELLTEDEGISLVRSKSKEELESFYTHCTGHSPFTKSKK